MAGVSGTGFTLTNAGTITGGLGGQSSDGGAGGTGGQGGNAQSGGTPGTGGSGGAGGNGGDGGAAGRPGNASGLSGSGFTVTNTGTIAGNNGGIGGSGGNAGAGGDGGLGGRFYLSSSRTPSGAAGVAGTSGSVGGAGAGGVGMVSTGDSTLINSGTIAGGIGDAGNGVQADAVDFRGATTRSDCCPAPPLVGNVVSTSGSTHGGDTLELGGTTDATLDGTLSASAPTSFRYACLRRLHHPAQDRHQHLDDHRRQRDDTQRHRELVRAGRHPAGQQQLQPGQQQHPDHRRAAHVHHDGHGGRGLWVSFR
ncbi:hypothetical protein [Oleiagrimonas soli]|uniref:Uncharacterized protein n=1 Tax=Oleiagrimonas soli TaxID=1543381 RepID=A0A841KNH2_9GAMM|nr:hypothetical protein [Oleiagrimonas soli]MBB6183524.1 hypothetical protein [Oleiagrimonas soli]